MSSELEKHRRNGKQTKIPGSRTPVLLFSLPISPVTALLGYFCFARRWKEGQEEENVSIIFANVFQSRQMLPTAEGTAEQTLLETCNTSISLSFWPLSMKANLYHRHKPGLKRLCPCATGSGGYAVSNLFSITGLESKPPDTHPLWHMSKLTGLWSSTCPTNGQLSINRHYVRNSSILPKQGTCFPLCGTV